MKRFLLLALFFISLTNLFADTFASKIKITNPNGATFDGNFKDGSLAAVNYILNDTADNVVVKIIDEASGSTVATINAAKQNPGINSVIWDGIGSATNKKYFAQVSPTRKTYSSVKYTCFSFIKTYETKAIYTRGVDANRDPNHPGFGFIYAANSDATDDALLTGILRYNSDLSFAGTDTGHPILKNTLGSANSGGTVNWGGTAPWYTTLDYLGRIYASANTDGKIFRGDSDTATPKIIIPKVTQPRGLATFGTASNFRLFVASDTMVVRAKFTNDTLSTLDTVALLSNYVRDVIIDDEGNLIAALRAGAAGGAGIAVEKYSLSGSLPVRRINAAWSVSFGSGGSPIGLAMKRGSKLTSADDDTLYVSVRGASGTDSLNIGIHEITQLNSFFPEAKQIFRPTLFPGSIGGNISANADLTTDYAGNIILFENGNEEIFSIAPPNSAANRTISTKSFGTVTVNISSFRNDDETIPDNFILHQNYPNPFNPSTTISFYANKNSNVKIVIYDLLGNEVRTLYQNQTEKGFHSVVWDGKGNFGEAVSSGTYLYSLITGSDSQTSKTYTKKMVLLK